MATSPPFRVILGRALGRRCPVCGDGVIFASFLRLRRACSTCRWLVEREPGSVTGAMYLISIATQFFAVLLFALFWIATDWSPTVKIAIAVPLIIVFSVVSLPYMRAVWVAVDYYTDVKSGETASPDYPRRAYAPETESE